MLDFRGIIEHERTCGYKYRIADPLSAISKYAQAKLLGHVALSYPAATLSAVPPHPVAVKYVDTKGTGPAK